MSPDAISFVIFYNTDNRIDNDDIKYVKKKHNKTIQYGIILQTKL